MCWACDPRLRELMRQSRRKAVWACDAEEDEVPEVQPNEKEPAQES